VVKALSGNGEAASTGHSAARTSRIMDEIVKEYYKKQGAGFRLCQPKLYEV
jgi:hypothetical protein